jgi:hypothetical protein
MLETHLAGKTTEKRQNFDPSTPPAGTEHLHFMLYGETRRAPGLPVAHTQTAWEDADKVSLVVPWYFHRQCWARADNLLDRPTSTRGEKEKLSNKQKEK